MKHYKHDCEQCKYLGTDTLHGQPADVYYCKEEQPYPTIVVRTGNEPYEYQSLDVKTLLDIAKRPLMWTTSIDLMVKYYRQLTIEEARILH
jgi:hypothetical protein